MIAIKCVNWMSMILFFLLTFSLLFWLESPLQSSLCFVQIFIPKEWSRSTVRKNFTSSYGTAMGQLWDRHPKFKNFVNEKQNTKRFKQIHKKGKTS